MEFLFLKANIAHRTAHNSNFELWVESKFVLAAVSHIHIHWLKSQATIMFGDFCQVQVRFFPKDLCPENALLETGMVVR